MGTGSGSVGSKKEWVDLMIAFHSLFLAKTAECYKRQLIKYYRMTEKLAAGID